MPRLDRPAPAAQQPKTPPDTARLLAATLDEWQHVHKAHLPPPLPLDSRQAAQWWLDHMQEPERPGETRELPQGEGTMRVLGYFIRARQALLNFLRLDHEQRKTVVAGVQDGVPYRGDDFDFYLRAGRETEHMREIGVDAYRTHAIAKMRELVTRHGKIAA
jgi:hypothetical protein